MKISPIDIVLTQLLHNMGTNFGDSIKKNIFLQENLFG